MYKPIQTISILGDGGWGTTLAIYLAKKGYNVTLWGAFPKYVQRVRKNRYNDKFLPGVWIPESIEITDSMGTAIKNSQLIVLASPSKFIKPVLKKVKKCDLKEKMFLSIIKGIDIQTQQRMSEIIYQVLGKVPLAVLSGPTIAVEVAKGVPSTAVIAAKDVKLAKQIQKVFNSESFRIYTNSDVIGVEIAGSVKNVIAIACGVCDGLGFGTNTKAAILSRGLAEMARLGKVLGAKQKTFSGLSGLGDLVTTCISARSRNRYVGEKLGKGKSIKQIIGSMNAVAEGVDTSKAVFRLSQKYNVSMPITIEVYNMIYKNKKALKAVEDLMSRKMKTE